MIKVAHTVTSYQSVVTILDSKLRSLSEFPDLDISVISSRSSEPETRRPAVRHIEVEIARSINVFSDLVSIWKMYRIFLKEKYDIVHSHTAKAGFITAIAAKMAGIKHVYHTSHGLPFYERQPEKLYRRYKKLEILASRFRGHLFTQNKRDYDSCVKIMAGDPSKVSIEGNGVDVDSVNLSSVINQNAVSGFYHDNNGVKIAMLCRYEPVKRIEDFLAVMLELKKRNYVFSAIITGKGPLENELNERVTNLGLGDCVSVTGYCEYPHSLLGLADIVMLCSEKEGIPRVLMEAMALGKPVVATDVLGTQELVLNGVTGFLAPLGDIDKLSESIAMLIDNSALRAKMGMAGKDRVIADFNDIKIAKFLHDFYSRAVNDC